MRTRTCEHWRVNPTSRALIATAAVGACVGAGTLAYALWEARSYRLREESVPVLPAGASPIRLLHLSDLHLTASQRSKATWVSELAELEPDFVVVTGDFISNAEALPAVLHSLEPLLGIPGAFVFGSNDYYAAQLKNPLRYFAGPSSLADRKPNLPTEQLRSGLTSRGWLDLNNRPGEVKVEGSLVSMLGTDDPHIYRDDYALVAGNFDPRADLRLGVTHAPYLRVLDAMAADGAELILAGHTHGGQVCLPGFGTLVTNCDLDRARARGLSRHEDAWLHVSAGLGTNPYTPIRVACPPEATLLTLTGR